MGVRIPRLRSVLKNNPVVRQTISNETTTDAATEADVDDLESAMATLTSTLRENTTVPSSNTVALFGPVTVNDNITLTIEDNATAKIKDILVV